jgi:hypothetical protein
VGSSCRESKAFFEEISIAAANYDAFGRQSKSGPPVAYHAPGGKTVKYLFAWILGVPGGLIVLWFLFNHMH